MTGSEHSDPSSGRGLRRLLGAAALMVWFVVAARTQADPDLWGHVRFGLDMLETRSLPSVDPYSFTQDVPWINHEWLSELQMGLAWAAGRSAGLAALKGALVLGAFWLIWRGLSGTDVAARMGVMLVVALGTVRMVQTLRPQLWSLLCMVLLCRALLADDRRARRWLPALFVVWVNVHGGWIVGLGALVVWSGVEAWTTPARRAHAAWWLAASIAATLVNPHGWELWGFIAATVRMTRAIGEWQPLWTVPALIWVPWVLALAAAAWLATGAARDRWRAVAVLAMLAYAAVRVERLTPFFVVAAVMFAAPRLRRQWPSLGRADLVSGARQAVAAGVLAVGLAIVLVGWVGRSSFSCIPVAGDWAPDPVAARALDTAKPGRLVVFFDWGQFALWHWGPNLRVSMDGRRETVYSDGRLDEHAAILAGTPTGIAALGRWGAEYVWLPASSQATEAWLAAHGYRVDVRTGQSFVAVRADLPALLAPSGRLDARRCFPA